MNGKRKSKELMEYFLEGIYIIAMLYATSRTANKSTRYKKRKR